MTWELKRESLLDDDGGGVSKDVDCANPLKPSCFICGCCCCFMHLTAVNCIFARKGAMYLKENFL